ncbi:MAG: ABC-2 transporter permease [Oscillospiraceae bacterium]|nr:ABC-2 transporter permease [Oscillospiraceae bacterium]
MKINWSLMREIIRVDRITMQGGKGNNMKLILIVCSGLFGGLGFFVSPLMGLYLPFLLAGFFVPMLFQNEIKYHSTRLWALLPIRRRDLVNARFLMVYGLYAIVSTVIYLLMVLALYLRPWRLIYTGIEGSSEGVENTEIVSMLASKLGLSPIGLFNLLFFACTALGIVWIATSLRSYFRDESIFSSALQLGKSGKRKKKQSGSEIVLALIIVVPTLLWVGMVTEILPAGKVAAVFLYLGMQLMQAADGFLLAATFLFCAIFHALYNYIATVLEYDVRDL